MTHHHWLPVLIVNLEEGYLSRQYLAKTPDGILGANWDTPPKERIYPRARLIGWGHDVPFELPVRFYRASNPFASYIVNGAWVLPYDEALYQEYLAFQNTLNAIIEEAQQNPLNFVNPFNKE